jgi:hypothetical protein
LVTSQKVTTGRESRQAEPTYNKKLKDVGWETFPTENVIDKLHRMYIELTQK